VLNKFGGGYINGTGAAALAYAIYLSRKRFHFVGIRFHVSQRHKNEKGRACVEYWLGRAQERGIGIRLPPKTSLMDSYEDSASDEALLRLRHHEGADRLRSRTQSSRSQRHRVRKMSGRPPRRRVSLRSRQASERAGNGQCKSA
jgi:hypothetical protein